MSYFFEGTIEELMAAVINDLKKAGECGTARDGYFERALVELVGVRECQAETDVVDPERLNQFRHEVYEYLLGYLDELSTYAAVTTITAESADDYEWPQLCLRRSVIQLLLDDYTGTPIAAAINPADVAELDEQLRRVGLEQGPVPEQHMPKGLPEHHWWWHYPKTPETPR